MSRHPLRRGAALAVTAVLAPVVLTGRGKVPFRAALGIALVDVALLAVAS